MDGLALEFGTALVLVDHGQHSGDAKAVVAVEVRHTDALYAPGLEAWAEAPFSAAAEGADSSARNRTTAGTRRGGPSWEFDPRRVSPELALGALAAVDEPHACPFDAHNATRHVAGARWGTAASAEPRQVDASLQVPVPASNEQRDYPLMPR